MKRKHFAKRTFAALLALTLAFSSVNIDVLSAYADDVAIEETEETPEYVEETEETPEYIEESEETQGYIEEETPEEVISEDEASDSDDSEDAGEPSEDELAGESIDGFTDLNGNIASFNPIFFEQKAYYGYSPIAKTINEGSFWYDNGGRANSECIGGDKYNLFSYTWSISKKNSKDVICTNETATSSLKLEIGDYRLRVSSTDEATTVKFTYDFSVVQPAEVQVGNEFTLKGGTAMNISKVTLSKDKAYFFTVKKANNTFTPSLTIVDKDGNAVLSNCLEGDDYFAPSYTGEYYFCWMVNIASKATIKETDRIISLTLLEGSRTSTSSLENVVYPSYFDDLKFNATFASGTAKTMTAQEMENSYGFDFDGAYDSTGTRIFTWPREKSGKVTWKFKVAGFDITKDIDVISYDFTKVPRANLGEDVAVSANTTTLLAFEITEPEDFYTFYFNKAEYADIFQIVNGSLDSCSNFYNRRYYDPVYDMRSTEGLQYIVMLVVSPVDTVISVEPKSSIKSISVASLKRTTFYAGVYDNLACDNANLTVEFSDGSKKTMNYNDAQIYGIWGAFKDSKGNVVYYDNIPDMEASYVDKPGIYTLFFYKGSLKNPKISCESKPMTVLGLQEIDNLYEDQLVTVPATGKQDFAKTVKPYVLKAHLENGYTYQMSLADNLTSVYIVDANTNKYVDNMNGISKHAFTVPYSGLYYLAFFTAKSEKVTLTKELGIKDITIDDSNFPKTYYVKEGTEKLIGYSELPVNKLVATITLTDNSKKTVNLGTNEAKKYGLFVAGDRMICEGVHYYNVFSDVYRTLDHSLTIEIKTCEFEELNSGDMKEFKQYDYDYSTGKSTKTKDVFFELNEIKGKKYVIVYRYEPLSVTDENGVSLAGKNRIYTYTAQKTQKRLISIEEEGNDASIFFVCLDDIKIKSEETVYSTGYNWVPKLTPILVINGVEKKISNSYSDLTRYGLECVIINKKNEKEAIREFMGPFYAVGEYRIFLSFANGLKKSPYINYTVVQNCPDYTLSFDLNGGEGVIPDIKMKGDSEYTLPWPDGMRKGYKFKCWSTNPDDPEGPVAHTAYMYLDNLSEDGSPVTLYAIWEKESYKITYHLQGGSIPDTGIHYYTVTDEDYALPGEIDAPCRNYVFKGWYTNPEYKGEAMMVLPSGSAGNLDLYAKWVSRNYTITFEAPEGVKGSVKSITVYGREFFKMPKNAFTETGRKSFFVGWKVKDGASYPYLQPGDSLSVNKNDGETTYSLCNENGESIARNISIGDDGKIAFEPVFTNSINVCYKDEMHLDYILSYPYGEGITKLPEPSPVEGYTFKGWYMDGAKSPTKSISKNQSGNITLTAKWVGNTIKYTYIFDGNKAGGNKSKVESFTYSGGTRKFMNCTYVKKGYTFVGWSLDTEESNRIFEEGDPIHDYLVVGANYPETTENVTLYAVWRHDNYTVTLMNEGAVYGSLISYQYDAKNDPANLASVAVPTKEGFKFEGWYEEGLTKKVTSLKGYTGNITLYAKWSANGKIVYHNGEESKTQNVKFGNNISLAANSFKKANYVFAGWAVKEGSDQIKYTDKQKFVLTAPEAGTEIHLYAVWKNKFYVKFDGESFGDGQYWFGYPVDAEIEYTYGEGLTLKNPYRPGYKFMGWYSDKKLSKKVTAINAKTSGDITLYAKWTGVKYTINYVTSTPSCSKVTGKTASQAMVYGSAKALSKCGFKAAGYEFLGWSINPNATTPDFLPGEKVTDFGEYKANITLYAVWKVVTYKIYFHMDGMVIFTDNYKITNGYSIENMTLEGLGGSFLGWYKDSKFKKPATDILKGTSGDIHIYGKFIYTR